MELSEEQKQQLQEQKQHCPFCKIVAGEIPAQKVYEDDKVLAILDINPFKKGHTLVLPKEHYPIMPLLPKEEFEHLFGLVPDFVKYLKEAMVAKHCTVYVANGAAAGQQSGHFMFHLIPSDSPISQFSPPASEVEQKGYDELHKVLANNLPIMMRERTPLFAPEDNPESMDDDERGRRLAELLEENPDFKRTLMENPDAVRAGIAENPSLQELFADVDIDSLSRKLREQQPAPERDEPDTQEDAVIKAKDLNDKDLRAFVESKPRLKELLLDDHATLKEALEQQERLQLFFEDTTIAAVEARFRGESLGLEDLAK